MLRWDSMWGPQVTNYPLSRYHLHWGLHIEWDCAKPRGLCTLYGAVGLS
jgi:hypothetical protein